MCFLTNTPIKLVKWVNWIYAITISSYYVTATLNFRKMPLQLCVRLIHAIMCTLAHIRINIHMYFHHLYVHMVGDTRIRYVHPTRGFFPECEPLASWSFYVLRYDQFFYMASVGWICRALAMTWPRK
jgi:hypothetical protein